MAGASNGGADGWTNSGYGGGTDGFGSWGGSSSGDNSSSNPNQNRSNGSNGNPPSLDQIHESMSEGLNPQTSPTGRSDGIGGLFSSRSSSRDNAYIRSVDKQRTKGVEDSLEPVIQESLEEEEEEEEAMPGDFLAATKRSSQNPPSSSPPSSPIPQMVNSSSSGLHPDRTLNSSPHSQLLTTLSPEAFKRVSTALEEVFGMVSGERREEEGDQYDQADQDDREEEIRDVELDQYTQELGGSHLRRNSQDSDERSFASAASEVQSSGAHTYPYAGGEEAEEQDEEPMNASIRPTYDYDNQPQSEQMIASDSVGTVVGSSSSSEFISQSTPQKMGHSSQQETPRPSTPPNQESSRMIAYSSSPPPSGLSPSRSFNRGIAKSSQGSASELQNQSSPNLSHSKSGNSLSSSSFQSQSQSQSQQPLRQELALLLSTQSLLATQLKEEHLTVDSARIKFRWIQLMVDSS